MPVAIERQETRSIIRLEGECPVGSAMDLKNLLVESLNRDQPVEVDLTGAREIGISVLQLLWAAEQEAARRNKVFGCLVSEEAISAAYEAGFERFPGTSGTETSRG